MWHPWPSPSNCSIRELYTGPTTFSGQKSGRIGKKLNLLFLDDTHEMSDPIDHIDEATAEPFDHLRRRRFHSQPEINTQFIYWDKGIFSTPPFQSLEKIQSFNPHRIRVAPISGTARGVLHIPIIKNFSMMPIPFWKTIDIVDFISRVHIVNHMVSICQSMLTVIILIYILQEFWQPTQPRLLNSSVLHPRFHQCRRHRHSSLGYLSSLIFRQFPQPRKNLFVGIFNLIDWKTFNLQDRPCPIRWKISLQRSR